MNKLKTFKGAALVAVTSMLPLSQAAMAEVTVSGWVNEAVSASRLAATQGLALNFGLAKPSDFEKDPELKKIQQLIERREELLSGQTSTTRTLSQGLRDASQFRFGSGSEVIGKETQTVTFEEPICSDCH